MKYDLSKVSWKATYNDGKIIKNPKDYKNLKRDKIKQFELINNDGTILLNISGITSARKMFARMRTEMTFRGVTKRIWLVGWHTSSTMKLYILDEEGNVEERRDWGIYTPVKYREDER